MEPVSQRQPAAQVFRFDQGGALLRSVMENAAIGMVLVGVDRRLLYVNTAFCEMLGYQQDEGLSLTLDDIVHEADFDCSLHLGRLISGEAEDYRSECQFRHKDQDAIWALVAASVLRSERTGRPLYVILQLTNIDRQKRAEAALTYAEARWSSALEAAGQGVWDYDSRTDTMYYSPMWRKMRGIPLDEYVDPAQEQWLARLHPDDRERIRAVVGKQETGEDGFDTLEYRERHRDGHYIWILSRGRPVEWGPGGQPVRTIGTDTDITRLKTIEVQLAEEKERLRVTLESIGDGVISTGADSLITFMNPIAEQMTGWPEADAIGRQLTDVFELRDQETGRPAANPVVTCMEHGDVCYVEADSTLLDRFGTIRDVRCSAAPVRTPDGKIIGVVLVFQDVTQSRALQKELAHSANHDVLTGLPNRAAFERALAASIESSRNERRTHALCFIDLDRFKPVNDTAGHAAGDALLKLVADAIRSGCRTNDFAARVGGDEFAVLLADCKPAHARVVAQKLVDLISAIDFRWNGRTYRIGACVGVTTIDGRQASAVDAVAEADAACYAAKAAGRGQVVHYDDTQARRKPAPQPAQ